jgi:hypothetical protein
LGVKLLFQWRIKKILVWTACLLGQTIWGKDDMSDDTKNRWSPHALSDFPFSLAFLETLKKLQRILEPLLQQKEEAYLVGGEVRNQLLGLKKDPDYDVAVSASPEVLESVFGQNLVKISASFPVWYLLSNLGKVEIALFRKEGGYQGRHPGWIEVGDRDSDADRRDLTINALYLSLRDFSLFDPNNGLKDLQNRSLKMIGNPFERFGEDYLRMVRLIRFAVNLENFTIDPQTWEAVRQLRPFVADLSQERILEEIKKVDPPKRKEFVRLGLMEPYQALFDQIWRAWSNEEQEAFGDCFLLYPTCFLTVFKDNLSCQASDWWAFVPLFSHRGSRVDQRALKSYEQLKSKKEDWFLIVYRSKESLLFWRLVFVLLNTTKSLRQSFFKLLDGVDQKKTLQENLRSSGQTILGFKYSDILAFFQSQSLPFSRLAFFLAWLYDQDDSESSLEEQWSAFLNFSVD